MAEEPEVIQKELDETRHALAEKLEQIGEKISGTVETVSETVAGVTETVTNVTESLGDTVQNVAESVSGTVESVKETVATVGEKAQETVEAVKQAFNLPDQVRAHPWLCVGGSVAVGFVAGRLILPRFSSHTQEAQSFVRGNGYYAEPQAEEPRPSYDYRRESTSSTSESTLGKAGSWLSSLVQNFGPELNKLKELALGTLFGVTRDVVARSVPESIKEQVQGVFNDVTEKVGGKPIQGSVLDESNEESSSQHGDSGHGEMASAQHGEDRQGRETAGRSNRR